MQKKSFHNPGLPKANDSSERPTGHRSDEAYRQAGVDLNRANQVVGIAKQAAEKTRQPWQLSGIGGFSGAFQIPEGYKNPVLLTACDGVGTKLKLAIASGIHHTVGIDLVAMSVNDILVNGGKPLVFLDYMATQTIDENILKPVLEGIAEGCRIAGCSLSGGETAEMPGFYANNEYDLAGFCVGVVEQKNLYPKVEELAAGHCLIGLKSTGLHSNGFSLARKILFTDHGFNLNSQVPQLQQTLAECLLTPTRIYVDAVLRALTVFGDDIHAMVHVTGGGFYDNIPRILPDHLSATLTGGVIKRAMPPIFTYLQELSALSNETMWHTFNCGIGYILVVNQSRAAAIVDFFNQSTDETALLIGELTPAKPETPKHVDIIE
ncbi:MAG: phosphoribosylformylglycinamidine cyclo-ligase [Cyanobacteria bacterium P01_H01_bin.74]